MISSVTRRRQGQKNNESNGNPNNAPGILDHAPRKRRFAKRVSGMSPGRMALGRTSLVGALFLFTCYFLLSIGVLFDAPLNPEARRVSDFPSHPLQIEYDVQANNASHVGSSRYTMSEPAAEGYHVVSWDPDPPSDDVCQPMHDWQTTTFPACNNLHEIDLMPRLGSLVFVNCGGDRCAFKLIANDGNPVALKIRKFEKGFGKSDYNAARKDGTAMERLTASPYVLEIYGNCGLSQLLEYSDGGNLHDLIKIARLKEHDDMGSNDKLRIGIQIASAVSDMHSFEKDKVASLAHRDLCCHQFMLVDGVYKLNDFHLSVFLEKNTETGEVCKAFNNHASYYALVHPPEANVENYIKQEQSDDYMAGNVMFYVLTKEWLYQNYSVNEAYNMLRQGITPPFPNRIVKSKDRAEQAMMKGIQMLWTPNVEDRPSTRQVADFLIKALEEIEGQSLKSKVIRLENAVPPLPKDHRFTDSDFNTMLG